MKVSSENIEAQFVYILLREWAEIRFYVIIVLVYRFCLCTFCTWAVELTYLSNEQKLCTFWFEENIEFAKSKTPEDVWRRNTASCVQLWLTKSYCYLSGQNVTGKNGCISRNLAGNQAFLRPAVLLGKHARPLAFHCTPSSATTTTTTTTTTNLRNSKLLMPVTRCD